MSDRRKSNDVDRSFKREILANGRWLAGRSFSCDIAGAANRTLASEESLL